MTMPHYLPQAYPLWCAEVYSLDSAEDTTVSRVVAWTEDDNGDLYPVLARNHGVVTMADTDPTDTPALLFDEDPGQLWPASEALKNTWRETRRKHPQANIPNPDRADPAR